MAKADVIGKRQTIANGSHIRPGEHEHRRTASIHRHVGIKHIAVSIYVCLPLVIAKNALQQAVESRRMAASRHIHVDGHIGTLGVVHVVGDAVVIDFCLPTVQHGFLPLMPV